MIQPASVKKVRVFVASPGDVIEERQALETVINELNHTISALAPEKDIVIELVRWETHARPRMGRPQQLVNEQIGAYDVFVGIMWKRFGTPTGVAASGTEEEFDIAYNRWTQDGSRPLLFYFCQEPFPPPTTVEEAEQLLKVVQFGEKLSGRGLIWEYSSHAEFAGVVRLHLVKELGEMLNPNASRAAHAERIGNEMIGSATSTVEEQVHQLAREYEAIRATMEPGNTRTRRMEAITTRMKALSSVAYPLVGSLTLSPSPGDRLAAIAMLEMIPAQGYIDWLAARFGAEQPFVEYHTGVALLSAVRDLPPDVRPHLRSAIQDGMRRLVGTGERTDRMRLLRNALAELDELERRPDGTALRLTDGRQLSAQSACWLVSRPNLSGPKLLNHFRVKAVSGGVISASPLSIMNCDISGA